LNGLWRIRGEGRGEAAMRHPPSAIEQFSVRDTLEAKFPKPGGDGQPKSLLINSVRTGQNSMFTKSCFVP
jgi:hypothetical protein